MDEKARALVTATKERDRLSGEVSTLTSTIATLTKQVDTFSEQVRVWRRVFEACGEFVCREVE